MKEIILKFSDVFKKNQIMFIVKNENHFINLNNHIFK